MTGQNGAVLVTAENRYFKMEQVVKQKRGDYTYYQNESAMQVVAKLQQGKRMIGLTRGQFSLIDLVYSILKKFGSGHVVCTTWSAGIKDSHNIKWMIDSELIESFLLITDHSYKTRQPKYAVQLDALFGADNIRTSDIHAKFVLIKCGDLHFCIRCSMNLNANKTCESFEIDEDKEVFDFYYQFCREHISQMPVGFVSSSFSVNRGLDRVFSNLKNQFNWLKNE